MKVPLNHEIPEMYTFLRYDRGTQNKKIFASLFYYTALDAQTKKDRNKR